MGCVSTWANVKPTKFIDVVCPGCFRCSVHHGVKIFTTDMMWKRHYEEAIFFVLTVLRRTVFDNSR